MNRFVSALSVVLFLAVAGLSFFKALPEAEKRVNLPNDANKLYVSLYVQNDAQADRLIAQHPQIAKYKPGSHFRVYYSNDALTKARWAGVQLPSAWVQTRQGEVIWASCNWRLFRRDKAQPDDEVVIDEELDEEQEEAPEPGPSPWIILGLAALGLAAGAGSKLYQELKGE